MQPNQSFGDRRRRAERPGPTDARPLSESRDGGRQPGRVAAAPSLPDTQTNALLCRELNARQPAAQGGKLSMRIPGMFLAVATLVATPVARAADVTGNSFTLEGYAGWQSLNVNNGVNGAVNSATENNAVVGGDLLFKASLFGLGLSLDKGLSGDVIPWAGSIMAGLIFDLLPSLRLEALGEVGRYGRDFEGMFNSSGQTFVGLRPGLSFRLLPSPIRLGVTVPVRWRTTGSDFGSPDWGIVGKIGLEF